MTDMPSFGARSHLEHAERADEFFVLLSDAASQLKNIETLRRVLAADANALAEMVRADRDAIYDPLRNLQEYASALARLAAVALERVTEIGERGGADTEDAATANGAAHHLRQELAH